CLTHDGGRDVDLVEILLVHEYVVLTVAVEESHVAAVDGRDLDLHAGGERPVDVLARHDVLELGPHECGALARLDVLELDDLPQLPLFLEDEAVLEIGGGRHCRYSFESCPRAVGHSYRERG